MSPHPARPLPDSFNRIHISASENYTIECYVDHYINSRMSLCSAEDRDNIVQALSEYPGCILVMLYEMNAWLDNRLGLKALYPDDLHVLDEIGERPHLAQVPDQQVARPAL